MNMRKESERNTFLPMHINSVVFFDVALPIGCWISIRAELWREVIM